MSPPFQSGAPPAWTVAPSPVALRSIGKPPLALPTNQMDPPVSCAPGRGPFAAVHCAVPPRLHAAARALLLSVAQHSASPSAPGVGAVCRRSAPSVGLEDGGDGGCGGHQTPVRSVRSQNGTTCTFQLCFQQCPGTTPHAQPSRPSSAFVPMPTSTVPCWCTLHRFTCIYTAH